MDLIDWRNLPTQTTPLNKTMLDLFQSNINNGKIDKSLIFVTDDLNTAIKSGLYVTSNSCTNIPEESFSYVVSVMAGYVTNGTTTIIHQTAYKNTSTGNATVFNRSKYGNADWGEWKKIESYTAGEWTPAINTRENIAPTVTYTNQSGTYKKIGDMVFISFYLRGKITALNGTNNYATIGGLPFTPKTYNMGECSLSTGVSYNLLTTTDAVQMVLRSYSGMLYVNRNNGAGAGVLKVSGDTDFQIGGSGWYETA